MYVIIWVFDVKQESEGTFERAYGSDGDWARFFAGGEGFIGTELVKDSEHERRYATLDRWQSRRDYDAFTAANAEAYSDTDARFEALTVHEERVGAFEVCGE